MWAGRFSIGIDPAKVTWQAPGLNHNIWLTHFIYEGKNAYIATKKRWFGEPWGGPDTHLGRPFFVSLLEARLREYRRWAEDPKADLTQLVGTEKTREQQVPIMDALVNNNEGCFQVNVPNHGALAGLPDDMVVEVPAIVN